MTWNGNDSLFGEAFSPSYLRVTIVSDSRPLVGRDHRISLLAAENATLPPILNAVEIYELIRRYELPTDFDDGNDSLEADHMKHGK